MAFLMENNKIISLKSGTRQKWPASLSIITELELLGHKL